MTGAEFKQRLKGVGLNQAGFARACGISAVSVNRWCQDKARLPTWAVSVLLMRESRETSEKLLASFSAAAADVGLLDAIIAKMGACGTPPAALAEIRRLAAGILSSSH